MTYTYDEPSWKEILFGDEGKAAKYVLTYIAVALLVLYVGMNIPEPRGVVVYDYHLCPVNGHAHFDPDEIPAYDELMIGWLILWPHTRAQADAYIARYPEVARHLVRGGCVNPEGH